MVLLPLYRMKFEVLMVVGSTGLVKTTRRVALVPTPTAFDGGSVELMAGPAVSVAVPVVNVKLPGLVRAFPAASVSSAL